MLPDSPDSPEIANVQFGDMERFLAFWKDDPKKAAIFMGQAIGRIASKDLRFHFPAIGASYFAEREICQRINFIYDNWDHSAPSPEKQELLDKSVEISVNDNIVCLHGISGRHDRIRVMLIRDVLDDVPYFSLRQYVNENEPLSGYLQAAWPGLDIRPEFELILSKRDYAAEFPKYELDDMFWDFSIPDDPIRGVVIRNDSQGFQSVYETMSLANLIVLTSQMLGYAS